MTPHPLDIPDFLKRKRSKKDLAVNNEYVPPKPRELKSPGWGKKEKVVLVEETYKPKAYRPSIQEAIREKHSNIIGEIEGMIDDGLPDDFSMFKYLNKIEATSMAANAIAEKYAPIALELNDVLTLLDDADLQEGYDRLSVEEVEAMFDMYSNIIDDCTKYASSNKKVRIAKKKKPLSTEKLLKTFKFLDKDDNYKIASIDPAKIRGAIELWAFNVKSKQLTVYRALDRGGLSVKGGSIINYDEKSSLSKIAGRHAADHVQSILSGGKIVLRKIMDGINTKALKPAKINKVTILLKVI